MNVNIFKEYDLRGIVDRDFPTELVEKIGKAFAAYVHRETGKAKPRISIGRDVRLSSPGLREALFKGLKSSGIDVTDLGICPTPLVYFSLFNLPVDGGVMITGSHNPKEYNGFKLCFKKTTLFGAQIQEIRKIVERQDFVSGSGESDTFDVNPAYQKWQIERHSSILKSGAELKVVVDAGNGTAGPVIVPILRQLGCKVIELFCEPDGEFPNHHPDPTIAANLQMLVSRVKSEKADLGLAFDGDSDRLGIVDNNGTILWGDEIMIILARDILTRHPGTKIIGEVKCSTRMYHQIAKAGGKPIMWKTGHSLIKNKMKEEHALLAGEMSGHLFFAEDYFGYDDAIHAALEIVAIASKEKATRQRRFSDLLSDVPHVFVTPEIRIDCSDDKKFDVVQAVRKIMEARHQEGLEPHIRGLCTIDGIRVEFEKGWGLVRASNTQPILVSRYEAQNQKLLAVYQKLFEEAIAAAAEKLY